MTPANVLEETKKQVQKILKSPGEILCCAVGGDISAETWIWDLRV